LFFAENFEPLLSEVSYLGLRKAEPSVLKIFVHCQYGYHHEMRIGAKEVELLEEPLPSQLRMFLCSFLITSQKSLCDLESLLELSQDCMLIGD